MNNITIAANASATPAKPSLIGRGRKAEIRKALGSLVRTAPTIEVGEIIAVLEEDAANASRQPRHRKESPSALTLEEVYPAETTNHGRGAKFMEDYF